MILSHVSDTHGNHKNIYVGEGDILIHSGDADLVTDKDIDDFALWMGYQKFKTKLFVPGNHDFYIAENTEIAKNIFRHHGIEMLINDSVYINDVHFYGMPQTPKYGNWVYMCKEDEMKQRVREIPEGVDVLISHGPPKYFLDRVERGSVGCEALANRLLSLDVKLNMFGHIHEGNGVTKFLNTVYVNSAVAPNKYSNFAWNGGYTIHLDGKNVADYYPTERLREL